MERRRFRFPVMTLEEFSQSVVPLGVLDSDEMLDVYNYIACKRRNSNLVPQVL